MRKKGFFSTEEEIIFLWETLWNTEIYDGENTFFVAFPGRRTLYGPDFRNAVIFVNGVRLEGDVECHVRSSFWFVHEHHKNPLFSNVRFHVVAQNDVKLPGFTIDISKIRKLNRNEIFICEGKWKKKKQRRVGVGKQEPREKKDFLFRLGKLRLMRKSRRVRERAEELRWNLPQILYELTAEALGYERFRNFMLLFARKYPLDFILSISDEDFSHIVRDEILKYKEREEEIKDNTSRVSGLSFEFPSHPANFPEKRLFVLRDMFRENNLPYSVISLFRKREMYPRWKELKVKGLGEGRLRTLIVNVFIPFILACGVGEEDEVFSFFSSFPQEEENRIIRRMKNMVGVHTPNMIEAQGMIELFKIRCSNYLCYVCPFLKLLK